jgi:hypothetical protein
MPAVNEILSNSVATAIGGGLAVLTARALRPQDAVEAARVAGIGLVGAAAVYPLARPDRVGTNAPQVREWLGVAGASALFAASTRVPTSARKIVAAGWVGHAVFDVVHRPGPDTRLPSWYAPMCAGYDLVLAAKLFRGAPSPSAVEPG